MAEDATASVPVPAPGYIGAPPSGVPNGNEDEAPKVYPCPECDRVFPTPQALGRHRAAKHGYKGAAKREAAKRNRAAVKQERAARKAPASIPPEAGLDAALLNVLYPGGSVPVSHLAGLHRWLAEAHGFVKKI